MTEAKPIVLIVDDTPYNIRYLVEALRHDYELIIATSGADALRLVGESPPDLILLDIMMPNMDGYEVCRRLKEMEAGRELPVIFVTAMTEVGDEERGLSLGAVDFVTKPFSIPLVKARVENHLALAWYRKTYGDKPAAPAG